MKSDNLVSLTPLERIQVLPATRLLGRWMCLAEPFRPEPRSSLTLTRKGRKTLRGAT